MRRRHPEFGHHHRHVGAWWSRSAAQVAGVRVDACRRRHRPAARARGAGSPGSTGRRGSSAKVPPGHAAVGSTWLASTPTMSSAVERLARVSSGSVVGQFANARGIESRVSRLERREPVEVSAPASARSASRRRCCGNSARARRAPALPRSVRCMPNGSHSTPMIQPASHAAHVRPSIGPSARPRCGLRASSPCTASTASAISSANAPSTAGS